MSLRPCPFCGKEQGQGRFEHMEHPVLNGSVPFVEPRLPAVKIVSYFVVCPSCFARGPAARDEAIAALAWDDRLGEGEESLKLRARVQILEEAMQELRELAGLSRAKPGSEDVLSGEDMTNAAERAAASTLPPDPDDGSSSGRA